MLDTSVEPAVMHPAYNVTWPSVRAETHNAVQVTWVAGYGDASSDVPAQDKQAIRFLAGHWYENREPLAAGVTPASLPYSFDALLDSDRVVCF